MKRTIFLLLFIFCFNSWAQGPLSWQVGDHQVTYDSSSKTYQWSFKNNAVRTYPRHLVERLIADMKLEHRVEAPKVFESLSKHATLEFIVAPTDEELLKQAFQMRDDSFDLISMASADPCSFNQNLDARSFTLEVEDEYAPKLQQDLLSAHLENEGFLSLGKLTGISVELMSSNDNLFHGMSEKMGMTEYNKGIDGNDRGKTFGLNGEVKVEFESGEINIRSTNQGYGRLAPQPSTYMIGGQSYTTYHKKNADGAYYQEFLNIEGLEVEVKKVLPGNDVFIKINGKQEVLDQKGLAQRLQKSWHEMHKESGVIQYDNLEHMDKTKRYELGASIGRDFSLYQNGRHQIRSEVSSGLGYSSDSDFHNIRVDADLRYQYHRESQGDQRYPVFETRLYTGAKRFADGQTDSQIGIELTQRFQVSENGFITLKAAVAKEDERYAREFGQEELNSRGRLDLQHKVGVGFELRF